MQERRRGRKFSTVGRLHPRFLREERLGENGGAFFNGKEGRDDFRKTSFWLKGDGGIRKTFFNGKEGFCPLKEGTEGSVKTIEEDRYERWSLL